MRMKVSLWNVKRKLTRRCIEADATAPYFPPFKNVMLDTILILYLHFLRIFFLTNPYFALNRFLDVFYRISGIVYLVSEIDLFWGENKFPFNKENCLVNYGTKRWKFSFISFSYYEPFKKIYIHGLCWIVKFKFRELKV